mmetsp:Transcript_99552/g.138299  ORF Transcript_99552/g.138299 Transcript_99552/m.138299 type:complete len:261 (-) Transcript_99552:328-1110(-)
MAPVGIAVSFPILVPFEDLHLGHRLLVENLAASGVDRIEGIGETQTHNLPKSFWVMAGKHREGKGTNFRIAICKAEARKVHDPSNGAGNCGVFEEPLQLRGHVLDAILGRLVGCTPCARVDYMAPENVFAYAKKAVGQWISRASPTARQGATLRKESRNEGLFPPLHGVSHRLERLVDVTVLHAQVTHQRRGGIKPKFSFFRRAAWRTTLQDLHLHSLSQGIEVSSGLLHACLETRDDNLILLEGSLVWKLGQLLSLELC